MLSGQKMPGPVEKRRGPISAPGLHQVGVRENVGRRRLRIALRRDTVRELRQELRDLVAMHAPAEPGVRVNVDESRNDRLAGDVDDSRALPGCSRCRAADGDDAIVGDDDVAVLDDLVALHRDDARATQHDRAARLVLSRRDRRRRSAAPRTRSWASSWCRRLRRHRAAGVAPPAPAPAPAATAGSAPWIPRAPPSRARVNRPSRRRSWKKLRPIE